MWKSVLTLLISGSVLVEGCATAAKPQQAQKETKKSQHAAPAKAQKAAPVAAHSNSKILQDHRTDDLALWLVRMGSPETPFTIQDRQKVASMSPSPQPGSITEAALVVGILRDIMTPPGGSEKFKEIDLNAAGQPNTDNKSVLPKPTRILDNAMILEIRAREKGVDITNALANNIILKNNAVFNWAWNAIALEGNSDIFRQNISTIIKSEAMLWQELAQKSGATQVTSTAAVTPSPSASPSANPSMSGSPAPATVAVNPPATPSPNSAPESQVDAEKAMVAAQEAAAKDNFAKAVEEASKIPSSAPNYSVAQDNIKTWSNRAVTDLRKKAAYEYRSSSSVTDVGVKRAYLTKAKNYLEEAVQKFPLAPNQDTVKENLGMINKELEKLN